MKLIVWRCHCRFCLAPDSAYPPTEVWWEDGQWWIQKHRVRIMSHPYDEIMWWVRGWCNDPTAYQQVYKG